MPEFLDPVRYLGNMQNHQRMYDFERDMLRVRNPLNADFTFIYDMVPFVVPANGTRDMERYLFRRYLWEMMGHIYNQITEERYAKAHEAFTRTHPDVIDDPYLLNEQIWLKLPRFDNPDFQRKIHNDCLVGVVSKFGSQRIVPSSQQKGQLDPNTPLFQQLINDDKELISNEPQAAPPPISQEPILTTPPVVSEVTLG